MRNSWFGSPGLCLWACLMLPCPCLQTFGGAHAHSLCGWGETTPGMEPELLDLEQTKSPLSPSRRKALCTSCNKLPRTTIFLPCSHRLMCPRCADVTEKCPLCEQTILGTVDRP